MMEADETLITSLYNNDLSLLVQPLPDQVYLSVSLLAKIGFLNCITYICRTVFMYVRRYTHIYRQTTIHTYMQTTRCLSVPASYYRGRNRSYKHAGG
jgi:hypothetical protein